MGARAKSINNIALITPEHFEFSTNAEPAKQSSLEMLPSAIAGDLKLATEQFQANYINQVLTQHENNWAATARALNIDSGNLHRLAKRLGLKHSKK